MYDKLSSATTPRPSLDNHPSREFYFSPPDDVSRKTSQMLTISLSE
jgi:hypothetical protein